MIILYEMSGLKTVDRWLTNALWHLNTNANPETIISTLIVYVQQCKVWPVFYSLYKYYSKYTSNMTLNTDTLRLYSTACAVHIGNLNIKLSWVYFLLI